ncbi:MAG: ester cyclase [Cyanobacteriota bacterium]|nr:ester cyclase [Cyanobacteriota bacterium]
MTSTTSMMPTASMAEIERLTTRVVNEAIVRRFWNKVWNAGQLNLVSELVAEDFTFCWGGSAVRDSAKLISHIQEFRNKIDNFKLMIEDLFVHNHKVVTRWKIQGLNNGLVEKIANQEPIELTGITIFSIEGRKIKKAWIEKS